MAESEKQSTDIPKMRETKKGRVNMARWQQHIIAGNHCFDRQLLSDAASHYQTAKQIAEGLFDSWPDPHTAAAAVIISYHNMADLYLSKALPTMAVEELQRVHRIFASALENQQLQPERRQALYCGVRKTYLALLNHRQQHAQEPAASSALAPLQNPVNGAKTIN